MYEICAVYIRNSTIKESDGDDKTTPLHNAARNGHLAKVKQLLDRGADITAKDENDDTPVHFAARAGHAEYVCIHIQLCIMRT